MNVKALGAIVSSLAEQPREFGAGWIEGRWRYHQAAGSRAFPRSWFAPGTVGRAASQAAVAYYVSLDGGED